MEAWHDPASKRDVWLHVVASASDWPKKIPWASPGFGLLVLAEHVVDVAPLAERALDRGLAVASVWGPAAAVLEDVFDEAIAEKRGSSSREVVVTTHAYESIAETIELFLDAVSPPPARAPTCNAWCVVAFGDELARAARRALERRGARPRHA